MSISIILFVPFLRTTLENHQNEYPFERGKNHISYDMSLFLESRKWPLGYCRVQNPKQNKKDLLSDHSFHRFISLICPGNLILKKHPKRKEMLNRRSLINTATNLVVRFKAKQKKT